MEFLGVFCVLGALGIAFLFWTAIIFAIRPKYFYRLWIGIPFLSVVTLICWGFAVSFIQSRPSVVFHRAVGFDPPADVTIINSLREMPIDWDDSHMVFYASDSTINQILQDGFAPIQASEIIQKTYLPPNWWEPPVGPNIRIYATNTNNHDFYNPTWGWTVDHKLLIYDPNGGDPGKRKVYFRYR